MGSRHSGRFPDFPPSRRKGGGGPSGGPGGRGPEEGDDRCSRDLLDIPLEEVGRSEFFNAHQSLPGVGTSVRLRQTLLGPRLSVDTEAGESVGFLPTAYNYLVSCVRRGFSYAGKVTSSTLKPVPSVRVNLYAQRRR
jgi:hypothetical protein